RAAFEAASAHAKAWAPAGEVARAFENLPAKLTALSVADPRDSSWPENLELLPKLVQYVAAASRAFKEDGRTTALAIAGLPDQGGFRLRINPEQVPKADAIRAELFPSVLATLVDDRGLRLIARGPLPLGCSSIRYSYGNDSERGERHGLTIRPFL